MQDSMILLYLLINIKNSNDIYLLLDKYNIPSVTLNNIYMDALKSGFIIEIKNEAVLTGKGELEILNLRKRFKLKDIYAFVMPYNVYKQEVISKDYIYVPLRKNIEFD